MRAEPVKSVLFLDDDTEILLTMSELLRSLNYRVIAQTEAQQTLHVFSEAPGRFDVVILNYNLNRTTGLEVARKMRSIRPDVPIVLFTGSVYAGIKERAGREGINEYLSKPATLEEVDGVLSRLCKAKAC